MPEKQPEERKTSRKVWILATLVFCLALLVSSWWMGPAPPLKLKLATGESEGVYATIGKEYQKKLKKMGLPVELTYTQGSLENLHLLLDHQVDAAFVQAGTYEIVADQDTNGELRGLVAIQWEPVWIFYRGHSIEHLASLHHEKKPKVAIGLKDSGTSAVAKSLLKANGIDDSNAEFLNYSMKKTKEELCSHNLQVAFFVSSPTNPMIQDLLRQEDIKLLSFRRQLAYSRRFPYLSPVVLGEGVIDLEENIPKRDVKLFATPTMLVCHEGLHPRAVEQLLIAARKIHTRADLVSAPKNFPTLEGMDIPVHDTAEAYMLSGESLVTRLLPYWGVWLVFKLQILLIPLLLVWLPFFKMLPMLYSVRINWLLRKHYSALRKIEDQIENSNDPGEIREQIEMLDNLRKNMERVSRKIPTHLQINVYQWRLHVSHVRSEARELLWHLEREEADRTVV